MTLTRESWTVCSKAVFIHFLPKLSKFLLNFETLKEGDDSSRTDSNHQLMLMTLDSDSPCKFFPKESFGTTHDYRLVSSLQI